MLRKSLFVKGFTKTIALIWRWRLGRLTPSIYVFLPDTSLTGVVRKIGARSTASCCGLRSVA
jgi:hypothetical protein